MLKRIVVGTVLAVAAAALLLLDYRLEASAIQVRSMSVPLRGLPLALAVALLVAGGFLELAKLSASVGLPVLRLGGMLGCLVTGTLPFWLQVLPVRGTGQALAAATVGLVVLLLFVNQLVVARTAGTVKRMASSLLAICYLGVCGGLVLGIRLDFGVGALVFFLLVVKAADVGAYAVGSALGRHKLIPWLSPGKSWEGLAGGLALAGAAGAGYAWAAPVCGAGGGLAPHQALVLGLLLGLFAQAGDLCESALKRDAGWKDSARTVPGFGGILDVIDSLLLAAPPGYLLLALLP